MKWKEKLFPNNVTRDSVNAKERFAQAMNLIPIYKSHYKLYVHVALTK